MSNKKNNQETEIVRARKTENRRLQTLESCIKFSILQLSFHTIVTITICMHFGTKPSGKCIADSKIISMNLP